MRGRQLGVLHDNSVSGRPQSPISIEHRIVDFAKIDALLFPGILPAKMPPIGFRALYAFDNGSLRIASNGDRIYQIRTDILDKEYHVSHRTKQGNETDILGLYTAMVVDLAQHGVISQKLSLSVLNRLDNGATNLRGRKGKTNRSAQTRVEICDKYDDLARTFAAKPEVDDIFLRAEGEVLFKKQIGARIGRYDVSRALTRHLKEAYPKARWHSVQKISEERYALFKARLDSGDLPSPAPVKPDHYWRPARKWIGDSNPDTGTVDPVITKLRTSRESMPAILGLVKDGMEYGILKSIGTLFGATSDQVQGWVFGSGNPVKEGSRIQGLALEHCIKLVKLYDTLLNCFKTPEKSRSFLVSKHLALSDNRPIDFLHSGYFMDWLIAHLEARNRAEEKLDINI